MTIRTHAEQDPALDESERQQPAPTAMPAPAGVPAALSRTHTSYAVAAGSARMAAYVLARQVAAPPGALTDAQAREAVEFTNRKYSAQSISIIQHMAGVPATGVFDEAVAQAVAVVQRTRGLLVDGKVGHQTLTSEFPDRVGRQAHDQLIHIVADLADVDITSETSAVRVDPAQAANGTSEFDPTGLRVIKLGPTAFQTSRILLETLRAQLRSRPPAAAAAGPVPTILDPFTAGFAFVLNLAKLPHPHSVRAISALVGGPRENSWSVDLVQRLAGFQQTNGLSGTGRVDLATLELLVTQLIATSDNNGAIRLIVDFFDFDDAGNLMTIYFDPNETANAATLPEAVAGSPENHPASIRVGPAGMAKPFASLVHVIEHEFSHVRLMRQNETDIPTTEFLSEAVEMTSPITPDESVAGFMSDASRGVGQWNLMPVDRQIRHRDRFIEVRQRVHQRHDASTPAEQATNQAIVDRWDAVVLPVGPPAPP